MIQLGKRTIVRTGDYIKKLWRKSGFFNYRPDWKTIIIAFLIGVIIGGMVLGHSIADTTVSEPQAKIHTYKPKNKLSVPDLKPQSQVASVYIAPPAPVSPSGCTTYWSGDYYLDNIIRFESGGNSCATNYLGCFGLLQACPGEPLRLACGGDPSCQITWFINNKTGGRSWAQVWQHELQYGWW